ncbi:MAG: NnrS family protein, partial [Verrucomicrobiae bacterium]|nr:NnrS family protein [Verrucomicrobiae bacterium]
ALACGLVVLAGFSMEALGYLKTGPLVRLVAMALYLSQEVPFYRTFRKHGTLGLSLALALSLLLAGQVFQALFPQYFKAMEHIVFMGGFGLLTFTVATRVILGHGGQSTRFKSRFPSLVAVIVLVVVALLTRISADIFPKVMVSHQVYAALIWVAGAIVWGCALLPGVFRRDDEPS